MIDWKEQSYWTCVDVGIKLKISNRKASRIIIKAVKEGFLHKECDKGALCFNGAMIVMEYCLYSSKSLN